MLLIRAETVLKGILMAWTAMGNDISQEIIILYVSAIFWTLGYDTIYGAQDMSDDEIIGLKSTSIKFKNNIKSFVLFSYLITVSLLIYLFYNYLGKNIFSILLFFAFLTLIYQVLKFDKNKSASCLRLFKLNNFTGLIIFISIFSINFYNGF